MEKQVAYSQLKFDRAQKEYMLSMAPGFPRDMNDHSVLVSKVPDFSKGCYHLDLKGFC